WLCEYPGLSFQRSPVCACSLVSSLLLSGATMSQQSSLTQSAHSVRQVLTAYSVAYAGLDAPILPSVTGMDAKTTRDLALLTPSRSSAQASPGLQITLFSARPFGARDRPHSRRAAAPRHRRGHGPASSQARLGFPPVRRVGNDDYDVLADGIVVGRIMKAAAAPVCQPWLWTLAYGYHEDR